MNRMCSPVVDLDQVGDIVSRLRTGGGGATGGTENWAGQRLG